MANSLRQYGAHVNDSSSYQVYNNLAENEDSILAVKDTYGKVIEYEGEVITAYYSSTSSGHSANPSDVWANDGDMPYLDGKLLLMEGQGSEDQSDARELYSDLSSEETFRSFLKAEDFNTVDSGFSWYRWNVTISVKDIKKEIDAKLEKRYNVNSNLILTKTGESDDGIDIFESIPVKTVGSIKDIQVLTRRPSGIVYELLIVGSECTIKIRTDYNIRAMLAPAYDTLVRQDGSGVEGMSLLPSSYFVIDKNMDNDTLESITISGGGYGHGVGASQNGTKALADSGMKCEDIISYFYNGTELGYIYE